MTLRSGEGMGDSTIKGMRVFIVECDFLSVWKILFLSMVTSVSIVRGCCHEVTFFCAIKTMAVLFKTSLAQMFTSHDRV